MRKILLTVLVVLSALCAHADDSLYDEIVSYSKNFLCSDKFVETMFDRSVYAAGGIEKQREYFLLTDTVKIKEDLVNAWFLTFYSPSSMKKLVGKGKPIGYSIMLVSINTSDDTFSIPSLADYECSGAIIQTSDLKSPEYQHIIPGSVAEGWYTAITESQATE